MSHTPDSFPAPRFALATDTHVELLRCYDAIVSNPHYGHFARIPDRIIRCMESFGIAFDQTLVRERLLAHYLFIGVVDDAIDAGQQHVGQTILAQLRQPISNLSLNTPLSDVEVVTCILNSHISHQIRPSLIERLQEAHDEVINERHAISINSYIEHRRSVGRLTAAQSYLLIRDALSESTDDLLRLMEEIAAVGCLVDSVIDLRRDRRAGLVGLKLGVRDFARLILCALRDALRIWIRFPAMTGLFVEAIVDIIRDRRRGLTTAEPISGMVERKDRAASVA